MLPSVSRWQGLGLIAAVSASTLWLAMTGQLDLYVAPRHELFVTVMAVIGLIGSLLSTLAPNAHNHTPTRTERSKVVSGSATSIAAIVAGTMLVLPPATLTSAVATQREINGTTQPTAAVADVADEGRSSTDSFTINEWASLLQQTSDLNFYSGRNVTTVGFVTPDPEDPDNMFYVSRFVITHCAIDARPIGLPIYLENWQQTLQPDQWIDVTGEFSTNRSSASSQTIALLPEQITPIEQPAEPYLIA